MCFGDFAMNIDGRSRAQAAFAATRQPPSPGGAQTGQNKAYSEWARLLATTSGLVYGQKAQKGTWEARAYWQHVEQYALDPNLLDSDFFEGRGNLEGFYVAAAYSFTAAIIGSARYWTCPTHRQQPRHGRFQRRHPVAESCQ